MDIVASLVKDKTKQYSFSWLQSVHVVTTLSLMVTVSQLYWKVEVLTSYFQTFWPPYGASLVANDTDMQTNRDGQEIEFHCLCMCMVNVHSRVGSWMSSWYTDISCPWSLLIGSGCCRIPGCWRLKCKWSMQTSVQLMKCPVSMVCSSTTEYTQLPMVRAYFYLSGLVPTMANVCCRTV